MPQKIKRLFLLFALFACLATPVCAEENKELIPVGSTVGIALSSDEVVIAALSDTVSAARDAGLKQGDILLKINETDIRCVADVTRVLHSSTPVNTVTVARKGLEKTMKIRPQETAGGQALGIYVRDSIAGVGTVTYYDPEDGSFGALGHGVNDAQSQKRMRITGGELVEASVAEIKKGKCGQPGALRGLLGTHVLGSVNANTGVGVFGTLESFIPERSAVPVAERSQVHTGNAEILCTLCDGKTQAYRVRIAQVHISETDTKNFLVKVEDERLLSQTGGIVQGMSGSPILQNGRLIGAVTHVLIDDPTTGYGIFIGNMLDRAETVKKAA